MNLRVAGIDIGNNGSLAFVEFQGPKILHVEVVRLSKYDLQSIPDIHELYTRISSAHLDQIFIESCSPHPKNGSASWKTLGMWFGTLQALCVAACFTPHIVRSATWMKALDCLTHGDKSISKARAEKIYGRYIKVVHGNADALLIAYYGNKKVREIRKANIVRSNPN